MDDATPLPHEEHLRRARHAQPDARLGPAARARRGRRARRVARDRHRPLAELALDEAVREIALSKLRLEEQLGRPVRAFAYVKGSEAHYKPVHLSLLKPGRLRARVHVDLGRERPGHRPAPAPPLQRRAVPVAHVRARARGRVRPDRAQGHRRRHARAPPLQRGARHVLEVSGRTLAYEPARRADVFALIEPRAGVRARPGASSTGGSTATRSGRASVALARGGRAASSARSARAASARSSSGERSSRRSRCAPSTDPAARGRGIFRRLQRRERARGARARVRRSARVHEHARGPDLHRRSSAGTTSPGCGSGRARCCRAEAATTGSGSSASGRAGWRLPRAARPAAEPLRPRLGLSQLALRRLAARVHAARVAERVRGRRAQAVPRRRHCVRRGPRRADVPRDAPAAPALRARGACGRARCSRCFPRCMRARTCRPASCRRPRRSADRHALDPGALPLGPKAWHFTLGDTDFF